MELSIEDWQKFGHDVPLLVNMQPAGFYLGEEYHRAGGLPAVLNELLKAKRLHAETALSELRLMREALGPAAHNRVERRRNPPPGTGPKIERRKKGVRRSP